MIRVRRPALAAMLARAAVTVVLPTPPFPATMTSRLCEQKRAGSTRSLSLAEALDEGSDRPEHTSDRVRFGRTAAGHDGGFRRAREGGGPGSGCDRGERAHRPDRRRL